MMLLHDHKILFLKPKKVAGTSFEIALSKYAGKKDIITPISPKDEDLRQKLGFRGAQNFSYGWADVLTQPIRFLPKAISKREWPAKFLNHISAKKARTLVGKQIWNEYTKVSIVRNPYEYLISIYFWRTRGKVDRPSFEAWCLKNPIIFEYNRDQYFIDGDNVVDLYIRFENFAEDIQALEDGTPGLNGLNDVFSKIAAKSGNRPPDASVEVMFKDAERLKNLVKVHSKYELKHFGYKI